MNFSDCSPEEKRLLARFEDLARAAYQDGRRAFSSFLNERQQLLAQETARRRGLEGWMLSGGYEGAVRCMLGFFPSWEEPDPESFPLTPVTIWLPKLANPSHRDVLGSLTSLQIKRESIGDILPDYAQRRCDVFVQQTLAALLTDELTRIGGYGVRCETCAPGTYRRVEAFEEVRGTVCSPRMDALVSILIGCSRQESAAMLKSEKVRRNDQMESNTSGSFAPGDVITIRGYGKYKVDCMGTPTKKGRLPVLCRKFI